MVESDCAPISHGRFLIETSCRPTELLLSSPLIILRKQANGIAVAIFIAIYLIKS